MRLWRIDFEELNGGQHCLLVASHEMSRGIALDHAINGLSSCYEPDASDIEYLEFSEVTEVHSNTNTYKIRLIKGGIYDWFNFKRLGRAYKQRTRKG